MNSHITSIGDANLVERNYERSAMKDVPQTLSEKAYRALSRMIQERELPSGKLIVESHLAKKLGVSRTPLRQALQRLESEGLLRKLESRSYIVRRVEVREYLHSLKVREILEAEAVELAMGRIDIIKIEQVQSYLQIVQNQKPYDMLAHWRSDDQVHNLFIEACGNLVMQDILKSLRITTKLFEIERLSERLMPDSKQHETILEALKATDSLASRTAVTEHLRSLAEFAIDVI
jgi:DNA-binding GntR family transcriptional regulator